MARLHDIHDRLAQRHRLGARLTLALAHMAAAEEERRLAIRAAHEGGLSIRTIARALGLSKSRVHQRLHTPPP